MYACLLAEFYTIWQLILTFRGKTLTAKRRSVENKNLCKLVYVKMNAQLVPNSLLPDIDSNIDSSVIHGGAETAGDMISFAQHVDTADEIELELCRQLAGPGQPIACSISSDEQMDDVCEEEGSWGTE